MKCIVLMKASASSEAGEMPSEQLLTEMGAFNEELVNAGIMLSGEGLHPTSAGVRVHFGDGAPRAEHGPFGGVLDVAGGVNGRSHRLGKAHSQYRR